MSDTSKKPYPPAWLKVNRRNPGGPPFVPLDEREACRAGAYAKCLPGHGAKDGLGCGATLMTHLDWQLHFCDPLATRHEAMRGFTDDHVVVL